MSNLQANSEVHFWVNQTLTDLPFRLEPYIKQILFLHIYISVGSLLQK